MSIFPEMSVTLPGGGGWEERKHHIICCLVQTERGVELTHEGEGRGGINLKKKKERKGKEIIGREVTEELVVREREKEREKTSLRTK